MDERLGGQIVSDVLSGRRILLLLQTVMEVDFGGPPREDHTGGVVRRTGRATPVV